MKAELNKSAFTFNSVDLLSAETAELLSSLTKGELTDLLNRSDLGPASVADDGTVTIWVRV